MHSLEDMLEALDADTSQAPIIKAPFSWPGGKGKSVEKLQTLIPYRNAYIEPFGGSGAVLLGRHKSKLEVFNDRYSGVTDFYRVLRDPKLLKTLIERLELTVHSREEWVMCKSTWQDVSDPVERAARWYYMLVYSHGVLGRNFGRSVTNSNSMSGKIRDKLASFHLVHARFGDVQIENLDWEVLCYRYDHPMTVMYLDPPYLEVHGGTYKNEMSVDDHKRLLGFVKQSKGTICVSGYSNHLYESAVDWDERHEWTVNIVLKSMGCEGNGKDSIKDNIRPTAQEVLWIHHGSG